MPDLESYILGEKPRSRPAWVAAFQILRFACEDETSDNTTSHVLRDCAASASLLLHYLNLYLNSTCFIVVDSDSIATGKLRIE